MHSDGLAFELAEVFTSLIGDAYPFCHETSLCRAALRALSSRRAPPEDARSYAGFHAARARLGDNGANIRQNPIIPSAFTCASESTPTSTWNSRPSRPPRAPPPCSSPPGTSTPPPPHSH